MLFMFSLNKNKSIENTRKRGNIRMSSVKVKFSHILILVGGNATLCIKIKTDLGFLCKNIF